MRHEYTLLYEYVLMDMKLKLSQRNLRYGNTNMTK